MSAKMVEHVTFNFDVLPTHFRTARYSGKTETSGWNIRDTGVSVGREELVESGQIAPIKTTKIVLEFKQLKNEIMIIEQVNMSSGFVISIVLCIISGVITFGLSLFRVLETIYYRRNPTKS